MPVQRISPHGISGPALNLLDGRRAVLEAGVGVLGGHHMARVCLPKGIGLASRGQAVIAMALAVLCISAWTSRAQGQGMPKTEYFVAVGATQGDPAGLNSNRPWTTIFGGGAYRVTNSIAVGVSTGWSFMGARNFFYFPPGGNLANARETFSMIPTIGYVKVSLPVGSHGGVPYLIAGAGAHTLMMQTSTPGLENSNDTRLGFSAAIGLSAGSRRFSPQVEARYDTRSAGPSNVVLGSHSRLDVFTVSIGVQLH